MRPGWRWPGDATSSAANRQEAEKDAADRALFVAALQRQLAKGDQALTSVSAAASRARPSGDSWPEIVADLDSLTETEIEHEAKRFVVRSDRRIDARTKTGSSPGRNSNMRSKHAF
jgi:hypothetical protein